jgi:hypothetical protein
VLTVAAVCGTLAPVAASAASTPPVPVSAQLKIRATAGAEAYVPTRLVSGMRYRFRIWSYAPGTLNIRFADLRFRPGTHRLFFTVTRFMRPLSRCGDGKQKTLQYDGNRVYWDGEVAWRCIAGPKGRVKVTVSGSHLPDVALARVVASAKRIS